jgi:hypothetical protein
VIGQAIGQVLSYRVGVALRAPVAIYFLMGDRATRILAILHDWMAREHATIMAVICLIIGARLIGDAITALAS